MGAQSKAELLRLVKEQQRRLQEQSEALLHREEQLLTKEKELLDLNKEIKLLRQKIDMLARRIFGKSSEKLDARQLELLLSLHEEELGPGKSEASSIISLIGEEAETIGRRRKRRPFDRKVRWPEDLPVVEQVIEPSEVQIEPQAWRWIGEEVSEQLDFEPAKFFRRRLVRPKYVHKTNVYEPPVIAPLPPVLQERCIAGPGLLAQIVVSKYCDHLPLYRQEFIYESRHCVNLSRQNMANWMWLTADWLRPIYEEIRTGVMGGGYVQIDETPIRYLEPGHGQAKWGYLWTACRPYGDAFYHWAISRASACLEEIVPVDFAGTIQCDAYGAYDTFARKHEAPITMAGCMAHARRKFHDALDQAPQQAGFILYQMQHLYKIERDLREHKAGPKLRAAVRAAQSQPIHQRIYKALVAMKSSGDFLPRSNMAVAINYTLSNWKLLGVYLEDGRIEIDNNMVENAIRPTAVGKKNWLFFGDAEAGERSAILFTVMECCRRHGIDPFEYLRDVLTRLPSMTNWQVKDITPAAWAKARKAPLPKAA